MFGPWWDVGDVDLVIAVSFRGVKFHRVNVCSQQQKNFKITRSQHNSSVFFLLYFHICVVVLLFSLG